MSETAYIDQVKSLLNHPNKDSSECITAISLLPIPDNANPLLVLIHGDSEELRNAINYANDYDPASPSADEIRQLSDNVSEKIITKIKNYLNDWDKRNLYKYSFSLKATYGSFKNSQGDMEYLRVFKDLSQATLGEAIMAAKEWSTHLLERVLFYTEQETGHKQISVKPIYRVLDAHSKQIAAGTLEFDDEQGVSTWLNQT